VIPFHEKPGIVINALSGPAFIATANHKIAPDGYRYDLGDSYDGGYRGARIQDSLHAANPSTYADIGTHRAIQLDHRSGMWTYAVLPCVTANQASFLFDVSKLPSTTSAAHRQAWQDAQFWIHTAGLGNGQFNGTAAVGSTAISFMWKWVQEYSRIVSPLVKRESNSEYWDELLFLQKSITGKAPAYVIQTLCPTYIDHSGWTDISSYIPATDMCVQAFLVALLKTATAHPTESGLRWAQDLKPFHAIHRMMTKSPLSCMFDRRHIMKDGDTSSVDVSVFDMTDKALSSVRGSSMRQLYSTQSRQRDHILFSMPGGTSGNPYSSRYTNLLEMWRTAQYINESVLGEF